MKIAEQAIYELKIKRKYDIYIDKYIYNNRLAPLHLVQDPEQSCVCTDTQCLLLQ